MPKRFRGTHLPDDPFNFCHISRNIQLSYDAKKCKRHKVLIKALQYAGVKVVLGEFKDKDRSCPLCKKSYRTKEEKQTDVNIAL
jgi:hypothetical protein